MNIYQKIILNKTGNFYSDNRSCSLSLDWVMVHDGSIVMVEKYYEEHGFNSVFDPERIFIVFDHIYPANNALTANLHMKARSFIKKYKIKNFYEGGHGISHQLLLENEAIQAGDILVGGDSHTPTIGAYSVLGLGAGATDITYALLTGEIWFRMGKTVRINLIGSPNETISAKDIVFYIAQSDYSHTLHDSYIAYSSEHDFPLDWRAVLCNMAPELGAVTALFEINISYIKSAPLRYKEIITHFNSDSDACFDEVINIDLNKVVPFIAYPHSVSNITPYSKKKNIKVDVVFIGTCTGGRLEDLISVENILKNTSNSIKTRLIINPASRNVYKQAVSLGLIEKFIELGATILPPSCGPCLGQSLGALADGEVCVSTANRNYKGRMGNKNAHIYLCSPETAARIAIEGIL
jgi:methanogen homoaconitase large subunit